ncbi:nucleoporin 210 isoform X2 [Haemaphysalis longicornis]
MAFSERMASLCCAILLLLCVSRAARLNVPRILLPYLQEVPTNYTLQIIEADEGSCFLWESSRTEVAVVLPPAGNCSHQATISAVWGQPSRQTTTVVAYEPGTGEQLRCVVIVDQLTSVEVVSTTRELLLGDTPELLELAGHNSQGDTFSSLDGISFDWSFQPLQQSPEPVLRFVPLSEWSCELPGPGVALWESRGRRSWAVLLEGRTVGAVRLTVRPVHEAHADVPSQQVEMRVVDSVQLEPFRIFLLPGCQACFRLQRLAQGRPPRPVAPGERHALRLEDNRIAQLDGLCVQALELGQTQLLLSDTHLAVDGRQPASDVHVVKPSYLGFSVSPGGESWLLERGTVYWVQVQLYDDHHHRIHPSEGLQLKVDFPADHWQVEFSTENGTFHQVLALKAGRSTIKAELEGCRHPNGHLVRSTASGAQEVSIVEPLSLVPPEVWLPWDAEVRPSYTVRVRARGGSGAPVRWQLEAGSPQWAALEGPALGLTATVGTRGEEGPGEAQLVARDGQLTPASMLLALVPVVEIEALGSSVLEAELPDGELLVPIAMYRKDPEDQQLKPFEDCSQVSLGVKLVDGRILKHIPEPEGGGGPPVDRGCTSVRLRCLSPGHTRLQVSHGKLQAQVLLGCYKPLRAVHPTKSVAVAYGSLLELAFEGGPRPWPMLLAGHVVRLSSSSDADLVSIMRIIDPFRRNRDLHVFRVLCKGTGETVLDLFVGNNASASLPNPARSEVSVRFVCAVPAAVELRLGSSASCPENKVPCSGEPVELDLTVREAGGQRLANVSSLDILWELSDYTVAQLASHRDVTSHVDGSAGYRKVTRDFQVVQPQGKTGMLTVTATVRGFSPQVLRQTSLSQLKTEAVSGSLQLELVEAARLSTSSVRVLGHPSHQVNVSVLNGSGHFALDGDGSPVARIELNGRQVLVRAVERRGRLEVRLRDRCLAESAEPLRLHVELVWPGHLRLTVAPQVQLGSELEAEVRLEDARGAPLSPSGLALVHKVAGPLALRPLESQPGRFGVRGTALGMGSLSFAAQALPELASPVASVDVFAPLRLEPHNLTLAVGATYQLSWTGGPAGATVEFGPVEESRAAGFTVSPRGLVHAVGPAGSHGRVWAVAAVGGRDEATVHVVAVGELRLRCALHQIVQGSETVVHVESTGGLGPAAFCTAQEPTQSLRWVASEPSLVSLAAPLTRDASPDGSCVAHVRALRPGHLALLLLLGNRTAAELLLEVVPPVGLVVPAVVPPEPLVLGPGSQLTLEVSGEASLEGQVARLELPVLHALSTPGTAQLLVRRRQQQRLYQVQVDPVAYALVRPCGGEPWGAEDWPLVLPVGMELCVEVALYNEWGQRFHATNLSLEVHSSRSDLVSVEREVTGAGGEWWVRVRGEGRSLVRWHGGDTEALLPLRTTAWPVPPLVVGERLWLRGPFAGGHWGHPPVDEGATTAPPLLRLTPAGPGCALAHPVAAGSTLALWQGTPQGRLWLSLEAWMPNSIRMEAPDGGHLLPIGQERLLPVHLDGRPSNIHGEPCGSVLPALEEATEEVPFTCWAKLANSSESAPSWLEVSAGFSVAVGGHFCRVRSGAGTPLLEQPEVPLVVGAQLWGEEKEPAVVEVLLVAPVELTRADRTAAQARLVFLAGPSVATQVQVRSLEGGAPLEPVRGPAHPLGGDLWQLVVRAPPSVAHLVLESLATGQRLRIPFQTETGVGDGWTGSWWKLLVFTVLAGAAAWLWFYVLARPAAAPSYLTTASTGHQRSPSGVMAYSSQAPALQLWSSADVSGNWTAKPNEQQW